MTFYSHPATRQDEWVMSKSVARKPVYLEIGAYDGEHHSNTLALEERGWRGMLVEPNPDVLPMLKARRHENNEIVPKCVVEYEKGDGRSFYCGGQYSGLIDRMSPEWREEHRKRGNKQIIMWDVIHVNKLYEDFKAKFGAWVHYLSLDTEGGELEILKSANWLSHVGFLTVEFRYDRKLLDDFVEYLEPWHRLDEVRGFDACFLRR